MDYREFTESDLKWIRSLERVMAKAPEKLFMFIGAGSMIVYSERKMDGGGIGQSVNHDVPNISVLTEMDIDGGDW